MANTATVLNNIRATYPSRIDSFENRNQETGLLWAVERMNSSPESVITPEIESLAKGSQGRLIQVPVVVDGDVSITNTRTCSVSAGENTTELVDIVWKTAVMNIVMTPGQYPMNSVKYNSDLAIKINRGVEAINKSIEADLAIALDNAKSQVYGATSLVAATGAKYDLLGSAIRVAPAQQELFFNDVDTINITDNLSAGSYRVIASPGMMPTVRQWKNQGAANQNNRDFQFRDERIWGTGKFDFSFTNGIPNGTGVASTAYIVPNGALGFMTRLDFDAMAGNTSTDGTEWSIERLPGLSFPVGLKFNSKCSDESSISGAHTDHLTATLKEHWQFSFDYATLRSYNSDISTRPNDIRKVEFL